MSVSKDLVFTLDALPSVAAALWAAATEGRAEGSSYPECRPISSVWLFEGALGSGKTTLIGALLRYMGVEEPVTSPTFSWMHVYHIGEVPVYHFDFYRLEGVEQAVDKGVVEYLDSGHPCFIEWPEKVTSLLRGICLLIKFHILGTERRRIEVKGIEAQGGWASEEGGDE